MRRRLGRILTVMVLWLMLAIGLAIGSLQYKQPANCQQLCLKDPCPAGHCKFGEQQAGFPLPVLRDREGGSPPSGWGRVGLEDYPSTNFGAFALNVLFYGAVLAGLQKIIQVWVRSPRRS